MFFYVLSKCDSITVENCKIIGNSNNTKIDGTLSKGIESGITVEIKNTSITLNG